VVVAARGPGARAQQRSAALRSPHGEVLSRFSIALTLYGLLGLLAWLTLPDKQIRFVTLALLAMFAVKSWIHHRKNALEKLEKNNGQQ
jgi:hypothetical protein